ncbi:hypothetical protein PGB90_006040 [Kerria lacca]
MIDIVVEAYQSVGMEINQTTTKVLVMRYDAPSTSGYTVNITENTIEKIK